MDGAALRNRRRALGYRTQADFAQALGISTDYVGQLERGSATISPRLEAAILSVRPNLPSTPATSHDPLERIIEQALIDAGIRYQTDHGGGTEHRLDFHLPDFDVAIEVKAMHTPRIAEQMSRAKNVIAVQGKAAVNFLADVIRRGNFLDILPH